MKITVTEKQQCNKLLNRWLLKQLELLPSVNKGKLNKSATFPSIHRVARSALGSSICFAVFAKRISKMSGLQLTADG
jgi:hypothetical protein